jgi:hypothetical protein
VMGFSPLTLHFAQLIMLFVMISQPNRKGAGQPCH